MDDTYSALFDLAEVVCAEVVSPSSNLDVAMRLDSTREAQEWIMGDLADLHRRGRVRQRMTDATAARTLLSGRRLLGLPHVIPRCCGK